MIQKKYRNRKKTAQKTSWGGVAKWYDKTVSEETSYQQTLILPNILRLLDPKKGQTILDLACGQGFFSSAFADREVRVIGVDISKNLIALAQKKYGAKKSLSFRCAPADELGFLSRASIDAVVCILALQNIENATKMMKECSRVLKPGGRFLIVLNHPIFRIPRATRWQWDEEQGVQYRRIDRYFSEFAIPIQMHPGKDRTERTISFHRPLQSIIKLFGAHGCAVTNCEEWLSNRMSDSGPRARIENRARKEFPLFLFLEARKV